MSVINRIAYFQDQRDEVANQELAKELADSGNQNDVEEIAENLNNENPSVQSDCLKVLYEIGYIDPSLISQYADSFLVLLSSKNNRMIWGSMIALSTIASLTAELLCEHYKDITQAIDNGSVITRDNGVKVLAAVSKHSEACQQKTLEYLLKHLSICRPKDVPQHSESTLGAVTAADSDKFIATLRKRIPELSEAQARRTQKVIVQAGAI